MQIHLFQTDISWENPKQNRASLETNFDRLNSRPGDLIILPEMYSTGFSMAAELTAEPADPDSPNTQYLVQKSKDFDCCVIGGVATRTGNKFSNESIAAFPNGDLARYQKNQPFSGAKEDQTFAAGNELITFEWNSWIIGMTVCYDLRFPELYRTLALNGAELIINIANWPCPRIGHWVTLLTARAIENQCYVAGVNRVGEDPNSQYIGRSIIVDPHGEIIADAGNEAGIVSATVNIGTVQSWRREFPSLADARKGTRPVIPYQPKSSSTKTK